MVNHEEKSLELVVANVEERISFPIDSGIAGIAATGNTVNINNCYEDERFNRDLDKSTGYVTTSILATSIRDHAGNVIGVIQAINKKANAEDSIYADKTKEGYTGEGFTQTDEELIGLMASQASTTLTNAEVYQAEASAKEKVRSLLEIIKAMHSDMGINSLLFTVTQRTHQLVGAER